MKLAQYSVYLTDIFQSVYSSKYLKVQLIYTQMYLKIPDSIDRQFFVVYLKRLNARHVIVCFQSMFPNV